MKQHIFILSGDPDLPLIMDIGLRRAGFEVHRLPQSQQVWDYLENDEDCLLIIDSNRQSNLMCSGVKARFPKTRILLTSVLPEEMVLKNGDNLCLDAYLEKPFSINQLLDAVKTALNGSRASS